MLKLMFVSLLSFLLSFGESKVNLLPELEPTNTQSNTGTLKKMLATNGSVTLELDFNRADFGAKQKSPGQLRFALEADSFFTLLVFNDELRGPLPGSMKLRPKDFAVLPAKMGESYQHLVLESLAWGGQYDLAVRDGNSGFTFFNIEGYEYEFDANSNLLNIKGGRLLLSEEYAKVLGRDGDTGTSVGQISAAVTTRPIEVTQVNEGEAQATVLPARDPNLPGTTPGPDVIVGDVSGLQQFGGSSGTQVGLALGTDSCNAGTVDLNWFQNPSNDHPTIPQNMYRMSGGAGNDERFEQIGQSQVKHAFTALTNNLCGFGCNNVGGTRLGSGCSDPYSASLNSGPNLGAKAWINPFTGFYPRNDSATPNNSHTGHAHAGPTHRILTEISDLSTAQNPGATYYAEGQYVTPHEYAHCQANPGQCNMYNNVSYRRYNVTGTTSFSFSPVSATVRQKVAVEAWPGAISVEIRPDAANDGIGRIAYKVTNPSPGVWHYEYAIYNQNLDRGVQSFSVPVGGGATLSNIGFHAPPQHPGSAADGTVGNTGFSSAAWNQSQAGGAMTWSSETFAQNPNANAIRWGTLYNFRFDSNSPPQTTNATIGFLKTGAPINLQIQGPSSLGPTPTPTPVATPTPTPATIVEFSAATSNAGEGATQAEVTVLRSGNTTTAVSVDYSTNDSFTFVGCNINSGQSNQRCDYIPVSGTMTFAAGETSKTISVQLADDFYVEGAESFSLSLSNLSAGATMGGNATTTVAITDNDTTAPADRLSFANLNSAQEVPINSSTATGLGSVQLNAAETQITVNMSFSGLSSAQTAAHIHGMAQVGASAPVLFNVGTGQITSLNFAVTPAQVAQLKAGLMYFDVHTSNLAAGEIRGQILPNPAESPRFFVRQQYADFLSRAPDQAGFDFWTAQITNAGSDLNLIRQQRVSVSNAFFFEQEYQQTGAYTYRLYRAAYGNSQPFPNPNPNGGTPVLAAHIPSYEKFSADRAKVLGGTQLAASQLALATAFAQRPEFVARYPLSQTGAQYVDGLLATIQAASGANLSGQRAELINLYDRGRVGAQSRGSVLFRLAEDNLAGNPINNRAFIDAEYNRSFVTTQYYGYLRRDADLGGLNFWLSVVNQFPLRSPLGQNGMVCSFITSGEYQQRFSSYFTRSNAECQ